MYFLNIRLVNVGYIAPCLYEIHFFVYNAIKLVSNSDTYPMIAPWFQFRNKRFSYNIATCYTGFDKTYTQHVIFYEQKRRKFDKHRLVDLNLPQGKRKKI